MFPEVGLWRRGPLQAILISSKYSAQAPLLGRVWYACTYVFYMWANMCFPESLVAKFMYRKLLTTIQLVHT